MDFGSDEEEVKSPSPKKTQAKTLITSLEQKKEEEKEPGAEENQIDK